MHHQPDEARHRRPEAGGVIGRDHVVAGRRDRVGVGEQPRHRRLVRHQDAYVVWVGGSEEEEVDRRTRGGEHVDRPGAERLDEGVQVLGVLLRGDSRGRVLAQAVARVARVDEHQHPVGDAVGEAAEAGGVHG